MDEEEVEVKVEVKIEHNSEENFKQNVMRGAILIVILLVNSSQVNSQKADEWIKQKETQQRHLQEQIAALKVYTNLATKGYKAIDAGIQTIRKVKHGDFQLHLDFISSFSKVNPCIKGYIRVAEIISVYIQIVGEAKKMLQGVRDMGKLSANELSQCELVLENLLSDCIQNITALTGLTADNSLVMKDDARIQRINDIYHNAKDQYSFLSYYSEDLAILSVQRMQEEYEVNFSRKINGLK